MARLQSKYFICLFVQFFLIMIFSSNGLAIDQKEDAESKTDVAEVSADAEKSDVAAVETDSYIYNPVNKTDPFKSFIATREEKEKAKAKTYLETLELSQLNLVVTVISPKDRWAMVNDSKGVGHVIKIGTPIGTNNGVVYKITQGEVVVREEYRDYRGETQYREVIKTSQSED